MTLEEAAAAYRDACRREQEAKTLVGQAEEMVRHAILAEDKANRAVSEAIGMLLRASGGRYYDKATGVVVAGA